MAVSVRKAINRVTEHLNGNGKVKVAEKPSEQPVNGKVVAASGPLLLQPMRTKHFNVAIVGLTPLIVNKWSEKAKEMMRNKQQKTGSTQKTAKDPEADYQASIYRLSDGTYGMPVDGIKKCMVSAAHKDIGIAKNLINKAVFIETDEGSLVRFETKSGPRRREDMVRVGMGTADLRYRAEFVDWKMTLRIEYDSDLIGAETVVNLLNRGGFGVGLCEWRPEKSGQFGRFKVVASGE